jgi:hypothetical protein
VGSSRDLLSSFVDVGEGWTSLRVDGVEGKSWVRLETCCQVLLTWGEGWTVSWRVDGVEDALRQ